jgi:hypothetical protein
VGFFKTLFGPSRNEIWTALQAQIGGQLQPATCWHGNTLRVQSGEWKLTLDEYTTLMHVGKTTVPIGHTRMRAPFPNPGGFRFSIHRASIFSTLGSFLGMQDIQVGHPEFDSDFVIKGNNEATVRALCSSVRLRALVSAQPSIRLSIQDDDGWFGTQYPEAIDVLVFDVAEHIRDVERLKGIYNVFAEALSRLSEMGIAGRGTGGVTIVFFSR